MSLLLTEGDVARHAQAIKVAQDIMLTAIKVWEQAKCEAQNDGCDIVCHDDFSSKYRKLIFPIDKVTYSATVEAKVDDIGR